MPEFCYKINDKLTTVIGSSAVSFYEVMWFGHLNTPLRTEGAYPPRHFSSLILYPAIKVESSRSMMGKKMRGGLQNAKTKKKAPMPAKEKGGDGIPWGWGGEGGHQHEILSGFSL